MEHLVYPAMLRPMNGGSYHATFPDLPGCAAEGEDIESAITNAGQALYEHLQALAENGEAIPVPRDLSNTLGAARLPDVIWVAIGTADPHGAERVNVYLPKSLLNEIEHFGSRSGVDNRSTFFRLAARHYMASEGAVRASAGLTEGQGRNLTTSDHWFRYWLPYCYHKLEHSRNKHVWLPLNRNYKPLGITSRDHVDYHNYINQAVAFASDPATWRGIWVDRQSAENGKLYLYTDGPRYRVDYFARLARVMAHPQRLVTKPSR
ncbi:type II toxin-antitoxin system HicB family antitoxin [Brevundimonas balnearis]|uniref:Type II toxin-antitoxin system HicB family antitoxin n=1 Tax=Brevundimonas balnearis TaxID=1572858 RepID=A0ABV6R4Z8_9CAUL